MFTKILELYRAFKSILFEKEKESKLTIPSPNQSYSQCGEDAIVDYIFKLRGISHPSFIDIGAHDPFYLNNTALFYLKGCRGINIEANPLLINSFYTFRPEDVNLNIGISSKTDELEFYIFEDNTLSTFSEHESLKLQNFGKKVIHKEKIQLRTVEEILRINNNGIFPDFLSIDVEGIDLEILRSINFENNYPKVICVEAAEYSPIGTGERREDLIQFLNSCGYFEYANTNLNAIMVRKEFWFI